MKYDRLEKQSEFSELDHYSNVFEEATKELESLKRDEITNIYNWRFLEEIYLEIKSLKGNIYQSSFDALLNQYEEIVEDRCLDVFKINSLADDVDSYKKGYNEFIVKQFKLF